MALSVHPLAPIRGRDAVVVDHHGCWIWQGCRSSKGYGYRRGQLVHRAMFELHYRRLRKGEQVHHRCEVKLCVNPAHLEAHRHLTHERLHAGPNSTAAVTRRVLRRGPARYRDIAQAFAAVGHRSESAGMVLCRMARRGEVVRLGYGLYALTAEEAS